MLERAVEIIKSGSPDGWPKTRENKEKVREMALVYQSLIGGNVECSWCARVEIYKCLKKWLGRNGKL